MKLICFLISVFFVFPVSATRIMHGPAFPWHDWYMMAYQGPNSFHTRGFDLYIQNVSSIQQTLKVTCEFRNLNHNIGSWGGNFTPLQVTTMDGGTNTGTNKFFISNVVIQPNELITIGCGVNYSSQENMALNHRDIHQRGTLLTSIEISEDRGAVVAYLNSRTENWSSSGGQPPVLKNDGEVTEGMLRNISKTFFYNGGRAF